jgi:putative ABC transport system permease protein
MTHRQQHPPQWPLTLLRFFVKKEYMEEIEGDMEEIFYDNVEKFSVAKAKRIYTVEMLKLIRPALMKNMKGLNHFTQHDMLKNYFKVSVRGLMKNPLSSFINVFGLAVAIGICLVVYAFLEFDYSIDQFHKNKNEVYLITFFANREGESQQYGTSPRPLGEMLRQDFQQIKKVCRVEDGVAVVKRDDNVFHEQIRYVDPEFLEMFTFPLSQGTNNSLEDKNGIVLSDEMAQKYFGEENPIGRDLQLVFNDSTNKMFTVTGVAKPFPKAHAIAFGFLVNFENIKIAQQHYDDTNWSEFLSATLIQVENTDQIHSIQQGMTKYKMLQNEVQPDWAIASFAFEPLATLHARSGLIRDDISYDDNREGRIGMPIIAIFMLTLACFNYINIAIVSAAKRLKEIGVRKVIGANRSRVITQFLTENIVVTFFALLIGSFFGIVIFIPWFVQFSGWPLEVSLLDGKLWIFLTALLLFTGIASGIYPAFYISKFDSIKIFKGSLQFGRKNPLTKVFLGIQMILACITITAGVVFTQNHTFQNNRSWGYNQKEALYANVPHQAAFEQLQASMMQSSNIVMTAGSRDHLGKNVSTTIMRIPPNKMYEVLEFSVDPDYIETMGLQLVDGRGFNKHKGSDQNAVVVNELLVKNLNLVNPMGQQFEIDSIKYEVIGVLKDFHTKDFFSEMQPAIFRIAREAEYRYLSLRVREGSSNETNETLQAAWSKLYPEIPFQGGHQEDVWSLYFRSVDRSEQFNDVLATIAVMLASLGLYGLVTLNVSGRVREFSIRKTLGAGVNNIASIILKQYLLLTVIALAIGAPVSYLFTKAYLDMLFAYPMPMSVSGIVIALFLLIVVFLLVVSTQIRKVVKTNPVEGLKVE